MDNKANVIPEYSPVCMIYSQQSLSELEGLFKHFGDHGDEHDSLRIIRAKDDQGKWRDTNRTIVLISERLYNQLMSKGFYKPVRSGDRTGWDFRLVPYEVRQSNLPKEGSKKDLFIRIPADFEMSNSEVEAFIKAKMAPLVKFGVIHDDQFSVKVPLRNKDRANDLVHGSCFLTFVDEVSEHTAALIKAVIDDTLWHDDATTFHCFWARAQLEKPPRMMSQQDGGDIKKIGIDKNGKKAFLKNEIVDYKEVPLKGKKATKAT